MIKSVSDNPLFREETAAAAGRAKEGGGVGERERTERGEEDMVLLVVIVWDGLEDCGAEMFEISLFEHMKTKKEGKRRSFLEGEKKRE
jgi:hypothetical protein